MSKILDTILKLFRLGETGRGASEAEMLSAVTKARQLMVKHRVSQDDVQHALNAQSARDRKLHVDINAYTAYTRKMKSLARYDGITALAIGALTETEPVLSNMVANGAWYVSMTFVGEPASTALASQLFMIWLPEVRRAARAVYGSAKWDKTHTSYAIGYATRIYDRAKAAVATPDAADATGMALVINATRDAIAVYKQEKGITKAKSRNIMLDGTAYRQGYNDGEAFKMQTKVVR